MMKLKVLLILCVLPFWSFCQEKIQLYNISYSKVSTFSEGFYEGYELYNSNSDLTYIIEYIYEFSDKDEIIAIDSVEHTMFYLSNQIDYSDYSTYSTEIFLHDTIAKNIVVYEVDKSGFYSHNQSLKYYNDSLFYLYGGPDEIEINDSCLFFRQFHLYKNHNNGRIYKIQNRLIKYKKEEAYYVSLDSLYSNNYPTYIDVINDTLRAYYIYVDTFLKVQCLSIYYYYNDLLYRISNYYLKKSNLSYPKFMKAKYDESILIFKYDFKK